MVTSLPRRDLAEALFLSATAGWVDALAFIALGGYFVSFMSGNTTRGAVDAATAGAWWVAATLVVGFVGGVVVGSAAQRLAPQRPQTIALTVVTALLAVAVAATFAEATPLIVALPLAAAMGAVNIVFARDHTVSFGVTYMTGALVKAAQGATGALWGERGSGWARYLMLWAAIAAGAVGGAFASGLFGLGALVAPLVAAAALLVRAAIRKV